MDVRSWMFNAASFRQIICQKGRLSIADFKTAEGAIHMRTVELNWRSARQSTFDM